MIRKVYILTCIMVLFFVLQIVYRQAEAADQGPQSMVLKTYSGNKPARFSHGRHQKQFSCKHCHHSKSETGHKMPYVDGMKIDRCITCHNEDDMTNPKLNSFKLAAHGLCKECHKQSGDAAPTKCSGCHIK